LLNHGYTLTINAGRCGKIETAKTLQIDGKLIAIGFPDERITFTSNQPSPHSGDMGGIQFLPIPAWMRVPTYSGNLYVRKHPTLESAKCISPSHPSGGGLFEVKVFYHPGNRMAINFRRQFAMFLPVSKFTQRPD